MHFLPACLQMTWNTPAAAYVASKQGTSPRLPAADPVPNGLHSPSGSQALGWAPTQEGVVQVADGGQAMFQAEGTGEVFHAAEDVHGARDLGLHSLEPSCRPVAATSHAWAPAQEEGEQQADNGKAASACEAGRCCTAAGMQVHTISKLRT